MNIEEMAQELAEKFWVRLNEIITDTSDDGSIHMDSEYTKPILAALEKVAEETKEEYVFHVPECKGRPCTCPESPKKITPLGAHLLNVQVLEQQAARIRELEDWILEAGNADGCDICAGFDDSLDGEQHQDFCMCGQIQARRKSESDNE